MCSQGEEVVSRPDLREGSVCLFGLRSLGFQLFANALEYAQSGPWGGKTNLEMCRERCDLWLCGGSGK